MDWLLNLRLIGLFTLYLAIIFILGTYLRWKQYRSVLAILLRLRSRWPNLTQLILTHRSIILTPRTYVPMAIVLVLLITNMTASRLVFPQAATFDVRELLRIWPAVPVVLGLGAAMVTYDVLGIFRVGQIDQKLLEGYFDQAESWLRGWKAPVVRVLSFGFVNPRKIVEKEVCTALENAAALLNSTLWWVTVQAVLRICFGLCLWACFAYREFLHYLAD